MSTPIWAQGSEPFSIKIDPVADINPVKTQHTLVATVYDQNGQPLPNQRVEWILSRGPICVGDIVDHDDKDGIVGGEKVRKLGNQYTVTYTNEAARTLDMGTPTPNDDIQMTAGQSWLTITSPVEGETHVIAFCPSIKNANNHKAFAIKYWIDAKIDWPTNAINRVGEPHTFKFKLVKASNLTPLPGYRVRWELADGGPPAYLGEAEDTRVMETETNEEGLATVNLTQVEREEGLNTIKVELRRPNGELLAIRKATKKWIKSQLEITKKGPAEGILNENVNYTVEVVNRGEAEARDVTVTDTLPEGMTYQTSSEEPSEVTDGQVSWNLGNMDSNANRRFTVTLKATQEGTWTNTANVTSDLGDGPSSSAITKIGAPNLYIVKEGPDEVRLGETAEYTLTIKNKGSAVARNVNIRDEIPDGMEFKGRKTGFALRWKVGTLNPGQSKPFKYRLVTTRTGTFENVAKAIMGGRTVHKATHVTKVIAPDLSITKEVGGRQMFLRRTAKFKITVTNNGDADALDVNLVDNIPNGLEYISSDPSGSFKAASGEQQARVFWKLGNITPGQTVEINLELRGVRIGVFRNTAKATSEGKTFEAFADVRVRGVSAMHLSTYDTEDPVEIDNQTVYVIEARNEGTNPCTNVKLTNEIPEEMEFVSAQGPSEFTREGSQVIFAPHPILQPGDKLVYRVVCRGIAAGSAKNRATLRYDQFQKPIIDEEGTSVYK